MDLTRRDVIAAAAVCSCCLAAEAGAQDKEAEASPVADPVDLGDIGQFEKPGIYDQFARSHKLLVLRLENRLVACSSICTHKACVLKKSDEKTLKCPCHGSLFDADGTVLTGRAKVALPRFEVKVTDGRLVVDRRRQFAERQWDEADSFVPLS